MLNPNVSLTRGFEKKKNPNVAGYIVLTIIMKGRKFIDSTVPSCHGRVQSILAGGPTTLRSNFRNKHQSCASQSCTLFGFPQQKQPLVRSQRQNIAAFSQVTRFYHTTLPGDKRMPSMQLANVDQRRVVS